MPTIYVPSPVLPGVTTPVTGSGFEFKRKVQLAVDNTGYTTNYFRAKPNGTFQVGINIGSVLGSHTVTARYAGSLTVVAQATVVVEDNAPPPPPPPPPPASRVDPPVTTGSATVPPSIMGLSDATAAFATWLAGLPNGQIINFPVSGTLHLSQRIALTGRKDLRLVGNGTTIVMTDPAQTGPRGSAFLIDGGASRIYIGHFLHTGSAPANNMGTVNALDLNKQDAEFAAMYDAHDVELEDITTQRAWGDGVYLGAGGGTAPCTRIWWHDSSVTSCGRNGIAIEYADQVWVERVAFDKVGLHVLDIEPDFAGHGGTHVYFTDNPVGTYGHTDKFICYLFAANGAANSVTTDVYVERNTVVGNASGYNGAALGLNTTVRGPTRSNIFVRGNSTARQVAGPVMSFTSVVGLTVTGNTQPLSSGALVSDTLCSAVVKTPNP